MKLQTISKSKAQKMMLYFQKLGTDNKDTQKVIEHLGYVQIDTISVVERAHHHVLWSRNSKYCPDDITDLMKKRKVFEHWSHAASILPMHEYRYSYQMKKHFYDKFAPKWNAKDKKVMREVKKRIQSEGPLQSTDFKREGGGKASGWWDWKPTKMALERLFLTGELEVSYRDSFRKVYDLPERVVPQKVDKSVPTQQEYSRYLIDRTLRHHGFASIAEIGYLWGAAQKKLIRRELDNLIEEGVICELRVEGIPEKYFTYVNSLNIKPKTSSKIQILSPFDNLVIQRKKLLNIFDFDYQIECYVPEAKRKYGYFALPIFKGTKGIGRVDCKVDRKTNTLIVKSLHSESKKSIKKDIEPKIKAFAKFNGCNSIEVRTDFCHSKR